MNMNLLHGFLLLLYCLPYLFENCSLRYALIKLMLSLTHVQIQSNQDSSDWDDKLLIKISKNYQY